MEKTKTLFNYNFNPKDIADLNLKALYEERRRDSCFAFAFEKDNKIYALRDHFGTVPLYFSWRENEIFFSTTLDPSKSQLTLQGYKAYVAFSTAKILPLFEGIRIVPPGSVVEINKRSKEVKVVYTHRFKKSLNLNFFRMDDLVEILDHLLLQAVKRTIKYDKVGLYLSGGIDSAITGVYLNKCGVEVNAYTCACKGDKSFETQSAPICAERIGVKEHYIDVLNSKKVKESLDKIIDVYKVPHGNPTSIGATSLWLHTPLSKEKQIYGAQGADTITCSVWIQNIAYMFSFIPQFIKRQINYQLSIKRKINYQLSNDITDNYIRFYSMGLLNSKDLPPTIINTIQAIQGKIQRLSVAGMLICHAPGDGEGISAPVINSNILYSNPFYDVDVAEFFLGIPLKYRINLLCKTFRNILDKVVIKELAKKYLNPVMEVKIGFGIPLDMYGLDKKIEKSEVPINIPKDVESKFSAHVFSKFANYILSKYLKR